MLQSYFGSFHVKSVNCAIKLLSDNMGNEILPLNTLQILRQKHSESCEATDEDLEDIPMTVHQIRFEETNAELIRNSAIRTKGGAGRSGLNGDGWRRILTSNSFGQESSDLCSTLAAGTKQHCAEMHSYKSFESLLASRLIPLKIKIQA